MSRLPAALIVVAVVMVSALAAVPAPATSSGYDDVAEAGEHAVAVEALAALGILVGTECASERFCPADPLSRWVIAVWLVRVVHGAETPVDDSRTFADVGEDVWWVGYVEKLAELGITRGCDLNPARYCPDQPVTRAQMASFLTRAFEFEPAEPAGFTDTVGNVHADSIDALSAANITVGCASHPARYCPTRPVTRAEMATFLARAMNLVPRAEAIEEVEEGTKEVEQLGDLHLVSQYTTYHNCCAPRVTNIHLFADMVDGVVVPPAGTFSLNRHVGQRTVEKGFVAAGSLFDGYLAASVGGGVSQFATTFYNAVFWGGYQDVFHLPHSSYFHRYPEGIEATINWPDLDLVFRNDSSADVLIRTKYTDTSITVKFFGDNDGRTVVGEWQNRAGRLEVVFEGGPQARVVTAQISERTNIKEPPDTWYIPNPRLTVSGRSRVQSASEGWETRVTRTINQAEEEDTHEWDVKYRPRRGIFAVHPCVLSNSCPNPSG